jgi:hypothetical protein
MITSTLRLQTRRDFNRDEMTCEWDSCTEALTYYNKEIRKARRSSWRGYCQGTDNVPGGATLTLKARLCRKYAKSTFQTVDRLMSQRTARGKLDLSTYEGSSKSKVH